MCFTLNRDKAVPKSPDMLVNTGTHLRDPLVPGDTFILDDGTPVVVVRSLVGQVIDRATSIASAVEFTRTIDWDIDEPVAVTVYAPGEQWDYFPSTLGSMFDWDTGDLAARDPGRDDLYLIPQEDRSKYGATVDSGMFGAAPVKHRDTDHTELWDEVYKLQTRIAQLETRLTEGGLKLAEASQALDPEGWEDEPDRDTDDGDLEPTEVFPDGADAWRPGDQETEDAEAIKAVLDAINDRALNENGEILPCG